MKKIALIVAAALLVTGCGQPMRSGPTTYLPYGVANKDTKYSPKVCYEISAGSVILGILLIETIIIPIYIVGWNLWTPVGMKNPDGSCTTEASGFNETAEAASPRY